jgi:hypothetical protein
VRYTELDAKVRRLLLAYSLSAALFGCGSSPEAPSAITLSGMWGGDHVALTVNDTNSHVELDCAHGEITDALRTRGDGTFTASGIYVREHGGPIREDEKADARPAMYMGRVAGETMELTIRLTDPDGLIGSFRLTRGAIGRVVKCL